MTQEAVETGQAHTVATCATAYTMRRLGTELLPGVRWHRHLLWRYSLVWTSPR